VQSGEACDDANTEDADQCTSVCALPACGDGIVQEPEECDDGNADETDGCTATCLTAS
jgi:cysteine-rich repeat protein